MTTDTALDENTLNEFDYTDEEKAELAKLDALNGDSDELTAPEPGQEGELIDPADDVTIDDDFIDDLLDPNADPEPNNKQDLEPAVDPEIDPTPAADPELDPDPEPAIEYPNYEDRLEESKQQLDQALGEVDDTLDKLRELAEKYDDGEISQGKYDIEKLALERSLKRQEKAVDQLESNHIDLSAEAKTKVDEYHSVRQAAWQASIDEFSADPANALLVNNVHLAEQFNELLSSMGKSGVFEGLSNEQILLSVRNQLAFRVPELAATPMQPKQTKAPAAKKPAKPVHQGTNIPVSMSQMNSKEMPSDDPFAYIRKLSGVAYEEAISKLTPEQQETFTFG